MRNTLKVKKSHLFLASKNLLHFCSYIYLVVIPITLMFFSIPPYIIVIPFTFC